MNIYKKLSDKGLLNLFTSRWLPIYYFRLTFLVISLSLSGCDISTESQGVNSDASDVLSNELIIANALYFNDRLPDDFYQETYPEDAFVSVSHVKNINLLVNDGLPAYELASDDFAEAMDWSEQVEVSKEFYNQLVDVSETDLYYQFTRSNPDLPELIYYSRVFKINMLDRSGVDRSEEDGEYKGKITINGLTATDVKYVVEYLWMFTFSNNYRNAILDSYTLQTDEEFIHVMQHAKLDFSYDETCDTVNLYEIRYTVPKLSGLIWKDKEFISTFSAKLTNGQIEICE